MGLSGLSPPTSICCSKKSPQLEIVSLCLTVFASPPVYEFLMHLTVGFFSKKAACTGRTKNKGLDKRKVISFSKDMCIASAWFKRSLAILIENFFWCRWCFLIAVVNNKTRVMITFKVIISCEFCPKQCEIH